MKNITLLFALLSALVITGCDKGADSTAPSESADAATESTSTEEALENAEEAVVEAAEAIEAGAEGLADKISE